VAEGLADALEGHGSLARLREGELSAIVQAERNADRVVLRCGASPEDAWTELCVREADLVVAVTTSDGRLLVDGGVLDNLPVATMVRSGEGPVIAVDVTGRMGQFKRPRRPGVARLGRPVRRALTGSEAEIPRLGETIVRTVTVGSINTVAAARLHADLVITPRVDGVRLMDWGAIAQVREMGRQAAREALARHPDS
jgi:predicted acylesterase/phospholipase RssA